MGFKIYIGINYTDYININQAHILIDMPNILIEIYIIALRKHIQINTNYQQYSSK